MKFSGKMCLMIILKVTEDQGFTLSLEDTFFENPQGVEVKLTPPAGLGLKDIIKQNITGNYEIIQKIVSSVLYPRREPHT